MTNAFMAGTLCTILVQTKAVLVAGEWATFAPTDYWCLHWLRGVNKSKKREREGGRKKKKKISNKKNKIREEKKRKRQKTTMDAIRESLIQRIHMDVA